MIYKNSRKTANQKTYRWKIRLSSYLLAALVALGSAQTSGSAPEDNVSFQIVTDKSVYSPHSRMLVKFVLTNTGSESVYIHRLINSCGSLYGHYELRVLNNKGLNVKKWECSADDLWPGMQTVDPVSELRSPRWIELRPADTFGIQEEVEVPEVRGSYRVSAEIVPPGNFSAQQKEILTQKQMRIMNNRHQAKVVNITVK